MNKIIRYIRITVLTIFVSLTLSGTIKAQEQVIDQIVAVVGKNIILESQLEAIYLQYREMGNIQGTSSSVKCYFLDSLIYENIFLNQAELDSIMVSDEEVEQRIEQRLNQFIQYFGSKEKLEETYGKTIIEIKEELREVVKDQLIVNQVREKILGDVEVSPSEVKVFYKKTPPESLPLINTQVEIAQIVKMPPVSAEQKVIVKEKLRELHRRVLNGESFAVLARLYSEDPGSSAKGGELGFYGRGELYPEFENAAFRLNEGEISDIVETPAGYHIIQMIEKKGDYVNVRHILLQAKVSPIDLYNAKKQLDSIAVLIREGKMTFDEAALKFSDDPGKTNGGLVINPATGSTWFEMNELDPQLSFVIKDLEIGQISNAVPMKTDEEKDAFRLVTLKGRSEPHRANLENDYFIIHGLALMDKQQDMEAEWVERNIKNAYIRISDRYKDCPYRFEWIPESD